jgi:hypothetical protein
MVPGEAYPLSGRGECGAVDHLKVRNPVLHAQRLGGGPLTSRPKAAIRTGIGLGTVNWAIGNN